MRPLCALAWRKALRVASPPGDRGGFIMLTRRASEKRSTTATIADGAADRPDEVGIGGCVPGKFVPIRARMRKLRIQKIIFSLGELLRS
jgi:hypothetical protein